MNNYIICVATELEKKALVPEEYWDKTILTGIGIGNAMKAVKRINEERIPPKAIINIGYAGAKGIAKGTVCYADYCRTYQVHDIEQLSFMLCTPITDIPYYDCYTSTDFVESSNIEGPFLVDMELLAYSISNYDVFSIKVVSDNMDMNDYDNALKDDYTKEVKKALREILGD